MELKDIIFILFMIATWINIFCHSHALDELENRVLELEDERS